MARYDLYDSSNHFLGSLVEQEDSWDPPVSYSPEEIRDRRVEKNKKRVMSSCTEVTALIASIIAFIWYVNTYNVLSIDLVIHVMTLCVIVLASGAIGAAIGWLIGKAICHFAINENIRINDIDDAEKTGYDVSEYRKENRSNSSLKTVDNTLDTIKNTESYKTYMEYQMQRTPTKFKVERPKKD